MCDLTKERAAARVDTWFPSHQVHHVQRIPAALLPFSPLAPLLPRWPHFSQVRESEQFISKYQCVNRDV